MKNVENKIKTLGDAARLGVPVTIHLSGMEFLQLLSLMQKEPAGESVYEHEENDSVELYKVRELSWMRTEATMALSFRAMNILFSHGLRTLGDLRLYGRKNIMKARNCGKTTLTELDDVVRRYNLKW